MKFSAPLRENLQLLFAFPMSYEQKNESAEAEGSGR